MYAYGHNILQFCGSVEETYSKLLLTESGIKWKRTLLLYRKFIAVAECFCCATSELVNFNST